VGLAIAHHAAPEFHPSEGLFDHPAALHDFEIGLCLGRFRVSANALIRDGDRPAPPILLRVPDIPCRRRPHRHPLSAAVGCSAKVASKSAFVAFIFTPMATACTISTAASPTMWLPTTRSVEPSTTSFKGMRVSRPDEVALHEPESRLADIDVIELRADVTEAGAPPLVRCPATSRTGRQPKMPC
jgi:hypothetical protein